MPNHTLRAEKWPPRMPKRDEVRAAFPRGRGRRTLYLFMRASGHGLNGHTGTKCDNCKKPILPGKAIVIERRLAGAWLSPVRDEDQETITIVTHHDCQNPDD